MLIISKIAGVFQRVTGGVGRVDLSYLPYALVFDLLSNRIAGEFAN